jgi:hypothetical protein
LKEIIYGGGAVSRINFQGSTSRYFAFIKLAYNGHATIYQNRWVMYAEFSSVSIINL